MKDGEYIQLRTKCGCEKIIRSPGADIKEVLIPFVISIPYRSTEISTPDSLIMGNRRFEYQWRTSKIGMRIFEEVD